MELLREEMKRVLRFLQWRALWWETRRSTRREEVSATLREGLEAYTARQAAMARQIARRFKTAWDTSAATAVRMVVRDAILAEGMVAFTEATEMTETGSMAAVFTETTEATEGAT